ncbi:hypothetical protein P153DRAFT_383849 [Dothidotthia symphoricarpi CBS 119687]|uniref:Uncharacterized protein n=1 Tax=Dothidotthia symphoricarpi CBS 119687 TaxID=1392245 RepID=A0A6A6AKV5_9PLEO|nr:uncharacterized protein P153DRAFT_383849 [Dothidotthia symphoricarpi CBS 119687]KAF2131758.1 hypothetical protein P153DRAFT_383849 [Dothidotthia symphoricarpi CBS 119687]
MGEVFRLEAPRLEHMTLRGIDIDNILPIIDFNLSDLATLHITWTYGLLEENVLERLERFGPSLRTLTLHTLGVDPAIFDVMHVTSLERLCQACTQLQFFGYQIKGDDLAPSNWTGRGNEFLARLDPLKHLKDLRILHFRFPKLIEPPAYGDATNNGPNDITWEVQRFANAVFRYMDKHDMCPRLKGMIFGTHWNAQPGMDGEWCYPRHCFVKGHQTDALNRTMVVAVLVPPYMIRQLEPDCDLLDFDPESEWATE